MVGGGKKKLRQSVRPPEKLKPRFSGMRPKAPLHEGPAPTPEQGLRNAAGCLLRHGHLFCQAMGHYRAALMRAGRNRKGAALDKVEYDALIGDTTHEEDCTAQALKSAHSASQNRGGDPPIYRTDAVAVMQMLVDEGMNADTAAKLIARLARLKVVEFEMPRTPETGYTDDEPPTQRG